MSITLSPCGLTAVCDRSQEFPRYSEWDGSPLVTEGRAWPVPLAGPPQLASTLCLPTPKLQQATDVYFDKGVAIKYLILVAGFCLCSTWNMYVGWERFETRVKLGG